MPNIREKSGKIKTFQDQGKIGEFKIKSAFENLAKNQGKVREFVSKAVFSLNFDSFSKIQAKTPQISPHGTHIFSLILMFLSGKFEIFQGKVREFCLRRQLATLSPV